MMNTDPSNILNHVFSNHSNELLHRIFLRANDKHRKETLLSIKNNLLYILHDEESMSLDPFLWKSSPSGDNHIIFAKDLCFFINIYGIIALFQNWLFFEGEMSIEHIHWIEHDNLVVFEKYFIVHNERQEVICHYSNDANAFVHSGEIVKIGERR